MLNKTDSKYYKTALRLLRQGNTMLKQLSEKADIDEVSAVTAYMHDEIEKVLKKTKSIENFICASKYVQLTLNFNENE